jgi:hypothetical protein
MAFTDEDIRLLVETGQYDGPRAVDHLTDVLKRRRDKSGRAFFSAILAIDNFAVSQGKPTFEDLAAVYGFSEPVRLKSEWFTYNSAGGRGARVEGSGFVIPTTFETAAPGTIAVASLAVAASPDERRVAVFLRRTSNAGWQAGIWRTWASRNP